MLTDQTSDTHTSQHHNVAFAISDPLNRTQNVSTTRIQQHCSVILLFHDFHNKIQGFFVSTQHGIKRMDTTMDVDKLNLVGVVMDNICSSRFMNMKASDW